MSDEKKPEKAKRKRGKTTAPAPKKKDELTAQQLLFVAELIKIGFQRAGVAYANAYPNCKESATDACASRLLKNAKIRARIEAEMNDMLAERKAFLEHEIFNFWYVRMTYDPTEIIGLDGEVKLNDKELRARGLHVCVESIKKKLNAQGDEYIEIELADRNAAAVRLDGYIHMTKPQAQVNLNVNKDASELSPEEEKDYKEQLHAAFPHLQTKDKE